MLRKAAGPCAPCNPLADFGCGRAFHQNPVSFFGDPSLRDIDNVDAAQQGCMLGNLTSATNLTGTFVNTSITANRATPPYNTLRSASQQQADEVNVYYHANRAKAHLNAIGFPGVMAFSIGIDAHDPTLGDNAHFVPSLDILEFGEGGVDDAQDSSIVYHEYGHAIQDNQVPGYGTTHEGGSAGEGFGDYWGASLTDDGAAPELGAACVAPWDATAYNPYTGAPGTGCLRRTDGTRQYPRDLRYEVHDDGEIWSSALWAMRSFVPSLMVDALVIKSHTFLTTSANFINGADALIAADAVLNGGANTAAIHGAMASRGIPRTGTAASSSLMTLTAPFFCESTHPYQNLEYRECRITQPGASRLRFHFTQLETESGFDFVSISDANYNQVQSLSGAPFGNNQPGFSAAVSGDTIVARFKADPSVRKAGFMIDQVQYVPGAGSIPDGGSGVPEAGLTIDHAPGGDVMLSWNASCAALDTDFEIYEGAIGAFSSHTPLVCGTGGVTSRTFTPGAGDVYYLVVPRNAFGEGSYGRRSDGSQRAPSTAACLPQELATTCL